MAIHELTASQAGLPRQEQFRIVLRAIAAKPDGAHMRDLYRVIEMHMRGARLSRQGEHSLRELVNRAARRMGYVHPHDPLNPGWRIAPGGVAFLES